MVLTGQLTRRTVEGIRHALDPRVLSVGLVGRGIRFAFVGGSVAAYYIGMTTFLFDIVRLPFQAALVIGFTTAICVHFTLQRFFVWKRENRYALRTHHQVARYLAVVGAQYGITAATTATLPEALGVPIREVYLTVAIFLAVTNFLVMRSRVFHPVEWLSASVALQAGDAVTSSERGSTSSVAEVTPEA
jgi:putative flippase GtrA